jgi:tetratricopeptide (TPR) repeat protein
VRSSTRHQLKQDRFAEATKETVSWAVEHRGKLITGAVVIAALLVIVIGGWAFLRYRDQQASAKLGEAMRTYEAPIVPPGTPSQGNVVTFTSAAERGKAAVKQFSEIAGKYSLTRSGKIARYFEGVAALDVGDNALAEKALSEVAGGNEDLSALAKFALASVYRRQNREADAVRIYKELIENPTNSVPKSTAQLELASLYEAKQPEEAAKIYQQVAKDSPAGPAGELANARLQAMK